MPSPHAIDPRYARQLLIPEWGGEGGQRRLRDAQLLVVGAGGVGSPLLFYLAAAGVGHIRVCDGDTVDLSNLNRQILHDESRLGMNKALSAVMTLSRLNAGIEVVAHPERVTEETLGPMAAGASMICCAVDDLETTGVLGRFCARAGIPMVWAGAYFLGGFVTVIHPPSTPCVGCCLAAWEAHRGKASGDAASGRSRLLPTGLDPGPIAGAAAGAMGSIQALEAIKLLVGFGPTLKASMVAIQLGGEEMAFKTFNLEPLRRPDCPDCGVE